MSERKVLNKYYPPDFDPSKIPKLKLPKDRQYVVRLMAPFNMRCKTCGEYIYKGKKFNARKETVQNEAYLGLPIFRFYIKCTRCLAEITFKVDASRAGFLYGVQEKRCARTRRAITLHPALFGFALRRRHVDFRAHVPSHRALVEEARKRRLLEDSDSEEDAAPPAPPRPAPRPNPTAILEEAPKAKRKAESWERSVGTLGNRPPLSGLVVVKKTDPGRSTRQGQASPTP
uniref:YJU2 splicing factor homolog n=1 Tax=Panthera tigris altaica TaxID=74533 RepID=A0A8C9KSI4_PANTA